MSKFTNLDAATTVKVAELITKQKKEKQIVPESRYQKSEEEVMAFLTKKG